LCYFYQKVLELELESAELELESKLAEVQFGSVLGPFLPNAKLSQVFGDKSGAKSAPFVRVIVVLCHNGAANFQINIILCC
jgi:hypothetical protein